MKSVPLDISDQQLNLRLRFSLQQPQPQSICYDLAMALHLSRYLHLLVLFPQFLFCCILLQTITLFCESNGSNMLNSPKSIFSACNLLNHFNFNNFDLLMHWFFKIVLQNNRQNVFCPTWPELKKYTPSYVCFHTPV